MFSETTPDLVIYHANELVTMNTIFGAPRRGKDMINSGERISFRVLILASCVPA